MKRESCALMTCGTPDWAGVREGGKRTCEDLQFVTDLASCLWRMSSGTRGAGCEGLSRPDKPEPGKLWLAFPQPTGYETSSSLGASPYPLAPT
ncbi:hypothetical protein E2C01_016547 [Portunus trituberculatus]|uniref:Uncharacterized protein n=1 Tax=Portunus trituberculatus TaxID=210409 RepID=A0A5B7DPX0_PORTR|nr:hypothetical protein [Portunus trituberculatus]